MNSSFKLTARQKEQTKLCASRATYILGYGGGRSGKTFNFLHNVIIRALKAPNSYHCIARKHFSHVKQSILIQTWPTLIEKKFKGLEYRLDKVDWYVEFANGSQIWFAGVDDKERMEKILGKEFCTIYLNEISEQDFAHFEMLNTRLAQKVFQEIDGVRQELPLKMYLDCNPPPKSHWSYLLFIKKINPETKAPLDNKDDYVSIQMNPIDNKANISEKYLEIMASSSARMKKRFLDGEFGEDNPNALFSDINFSTHRVIDGELPDMVRVIVAVDPSGSGDEDNAHNDEIGIVCGGLGTDGRAYLLEDCTIKAGPKTWSTVATSLFERRRADLLVAEKNFGGDMVRFTIQTAKQDVPFKFVTATRGKVVRAEPFSSLYEQGKIRHAGYYHELEDEMLGFSTIGYTGKKSPNRADAWIWVLTELFSGLVREKKEIPKLKPSGFGW